MCELHTSIERYIPVDVQVAFNIDTPMQNMVRVGVVKDASMLLRSMAFLADKDYESLSRGDRQDYIFAKRKLLPERSVPCAIFPITEEVDYRVNMGVESICPFLEYYSINVALFAEVKQKLALVDYFETSQTSDTIAVYKLSDYMFNPILVDGCATFEVDRIESFCSLPLGTT